jgi:GAF domain-containing protein
MGSHEELTSRVRGLLARIGEGADVHETLEEVLAAVGEASGCESVGIRWKAGEDCPYLLTRGFGREFVVVEGPLCVRDTAGLILRHRDGRPQLACMCGAVVQGRTDPSLPYFTQGGSFWTSGTSHLLAESPPVKQTGVTTRNYCNQVGYESVALMPLRSGGETYGVLQMNSRAPGRFTEGTIAAYEEVAEEIAEAVVGRVDEAEGRPSLG